MASLKSVKRGIKANGGGGETGHRNQGRRRRQQIKTTHWENMASRENWPAVLAQTPHSLTLAPSPCILFIEKFHPPSCDTEPTRNELSLITQACNEARVTNVNKV